MLRLFGENAKRCPEKYKRVCFMLDAMSIKKHVSFDPSKQQTIGCVDLGYGPDDENIASEALVFMVVGLMGHWKAPIAYFLTRTLTQEVQKSLVEAALVALHQQGVEVKCLTMDGHATNLGMVRMFGCDLRQPDNLKTSFPHPFSGHPIHILIDPCHVLKIIRNMWEAYKSVASASGHVNWSYLQCLHALQTNEGLHLANKLSQRHIAFKKQIMKVSLAAQTISSSVANSMQFLMEEEVELFLSCRGHN
jgi:hypothetical protein